MTTQAIPDRALVDAREAPAAKRAVSWAAGRWPSLIGLLIAAGLVIDAHAADVAPLVLVIAINYVVAAATEKRWTVLIGTVALFIIMPVVPRLDPGLVRGLVLGIGVAFVLGGAAVALARSRREVGLQTVAMLGFGALAATATYVDPSVGIYVVAAGLIAHGIWDIVHHVRDAVVPRRYAEFCFVLDLAAGVALIWLA